MTSTERGLPGVGTASSAGRNVTMCLLMETSAQQRSARFGWHRLFMGCPCGQSGPSWGRSITRACSGRWPRAPTWITRPSGTWPVADGRFRSGRRRHRDSTPMACRGWRRYAPAVMSPICWTTSRGVVDFGSGVVHALW